MSKFSNSCGNTVALPIRWGWTALNTWWDVLKTLWNPIRDFGDVVVDTSNKAWEVLSSSWTEGKWYNKLYQVPAGLIVSWATVVEGAVRAVVEPVRNLFLNVRDSLWNFFNNIWNTIKRTFDTTRPVSDFSYEKLKLRTPTRKNWMSRLARRKKSWNTENGA